MTSTNANENLSDLLGEGFDFTADLDKANLPEGKYLCTVQSVEFRNTPKDDGRISRGLMVSLKIDASDYPALADYDGQYLPGDFIWLGYEKIERMGLQRLKAFIDAVTQQDSSGVIDWNAYGLHRKSDGKVYLTYFEGMPVGVNYGRRKDRNQVLNYIPADALKPEFNNEEPF